MPAGNTIPLRRVGLRLIAMLSGAAAFLSVASASGARAAVITFTTTGTIYLGEDFGPFGFGSQDGPASLVGRSYTISQDFQTASITSTSSGLFGSETQRATFAVSQTRVVVDGVTLIFNIDGSYVSPNSWLEIRNGINPATGSPLGYDQIYGYNIGYNYALPGANSGPQNFDQIQQYVYSFSNDFLSTADLTESFSYNLQIGRDFSYGELLMYRYAVDRYDAYFSGTPLIATLSYTPAITDVPEPTSLVLLSTSLLALAMVRRRRGGAADPRY